MKWRPHHSSNNSSNRTHSRGPAQVSAVPNQGVSGVPLTIQCNHTLLQTTMYQTTLT